MINSFGDKQIRNAIICVQLVIKLASICTRCARCNWCLKLIHFWSSFQLEWCIRSDYTTHYRSFALYNCLSEKSKPELCYCQSAAQCDSYNFDCGFAFYLLSCLLISDISATAVEHIIGSFLISGTWLCNSMVWGWRTLDTENDSNCLCILTLATDNALNYSV